MPVFIIQKQYFMDDGSGEFQRQLHQGLRDGGADEVRVVRAAAQDDAQRHDGVRPFSGERDRMDLMVTGISKAPGTRTTSSRADGSTAASSSEQLSTRAWVYCSLYSEATMQIWRAFP